MMTLADVHAYLMSKQGACKERPFDPETPVYKVMGKMFAILASEQSSIRITLKCDPDHGLILRDVYDAVTPGYHTNKRHWNTVTLDGTIPTDEIEEMIDESYDLVVAGLTRAARRELVGMENTRSIIGRDKAA